jgi:hypothetical protein
MTSNDTKMTWRDQLVVGYPALFRTYRQTGIGTFRIGDGWQDIVATMLARITTALSATAGNFVTVESVESKHGGLLVHLSGLVTDASVRTAVEDAVDLAEARSASICELCGADGRLFETELRWLMTACDDHGRGASPIALGENARLPVHRAADGRIIGSRRYDKDTDCFVDIAPDDIGLPHGPRTIETNRNAAESK